MQIVLTLRDDEDVWWKSLVNQMKASDKFLPRMMEILSPTAGRSANRIVNPMSEYRENNYIIAQTLTKLAKEGTHLQ